MSKGVIIHLDDKEDVLKGSETLFKQLGIDLQLVICQNKKSFDDAILAFSSSLKCLIFDLWGENPSENELTGKEMEFLDYIENNFAQYNIPIFIYSGHLDSIRDRFNTDGTVFKVDKEKGIDEIFEKIKFFLESGFLNVFSPGGILEKEFHKDLHKAFVKQFTDNTQIAKIIEEINQSGLSNNVERVEKVFKRIGVRALLSKLLAPEIADDGTMLVEFVHPSEHYLQRISGFPIWTGDIFKNKSTEQHLLIITPRCNVASKGSSETLVCELIPGDFPSETSNRAGKDKINYALNDKPEVSGYDRFLPPSPCFIGGKVVLSSYFIIKSSNLTNDYNRVISLSDELTNEILGKFGAYFFRTGITPFNKSEAIAHITSRKVYADKK